MAEPVGRTVSAAASDSAVVSESLEGLVSAVDELKRSMGLGEQAVDFAGVEAFIQQMRQENEELRNFAEEAIYSAQRLRAERDELQSRLDQVSLEATMGAALQETQKLKDVSDEFERDLAAQKLAEAEARAGEMEALQQRVTELEDENAGLTQTLNEFRQTTQQLQKLQSHEMRRLQTVEKSGSASTAGADTASGAPPAAAGAAPPPQQQQQQRRRQSNGRRSSFTGSAAGSPTGRGSGVGVAVGLRSVQAEEASRIAEQLEDVAGGAESGLLAEAAVALRELSRRDAQLVQAQQEAARLRSEVDELNDTMFSKTFKPPSAWAEREIKYKSEKKYWEEQHKATATRLAALSREMEAYNGASKAQQLEERIQELEALLLQSERENNSVRSQLHDVQLSMRTEGEFGNAGKRMSPYMSPLGLSSLGEGHDVQHMVDQMQGGTAASASPEVLGARVHGLEAQLQAVANENEALRRQLLEQQMVPVPASLQGELGQAASAASVVAAAANIEARLQQAEVEGEALRRQLGGGGAAGSAQDQEAAAAEPQHQLQARAQQAEAAGDAGEAERLRQQVAQLEALASRLHAAEQERQTLSSQLQVLQPVCLQISAAGAASLEAAGQEVEVPAAMQGELGGVVAPAAAVLRKAAELEQRLDSASAESSELKQLMAVTVALEQHAAQAAAKEQQLEARVQAPGSPGAAAEEEAGALRQELAAAQRQKEVAQRQLWQLHELQEQLQAGAAERRKLGAQLVAARPVSLQLAAGELAQEEETADVAQLRAELAEAQRRSTDLLAQLQALHPAVGAKGQPLSDAEAAVRLQEVEEEGQRLRQQLADLQSAHLQLLVASPAPPDSASARRSLSYAVPASPSDVPLMAGEASDGSMAALLYSSEHATALTAERRAADAALREYQKSTDVPSLLRAKAELETRCEILESQISKMQGALAHADEANAVFEDHLDSALKSGDVTVLSGLKERLSAGRQSLSKRMFKRQPKAGVSPSKDSLKTTMHEMQDALTSSEEEKNALKRQLAKLSKKYQQVTQQAAHTAGIVAGAQAMQAGAGESGDPSPEASLNGLGLNEDGELELLKMREESQMLMEHVVMVKVRQAEMEGEYLEAKRQLLRTREKNLQLARKLQDVREAAERGEPLPFTPKQGGAPEGSKGALAAGLASFTFNNASSGAQQEQAGATPRTDAKQKSKLRIPGL